MLPSTFIIRKSDIPLHTNIFRLETAQALKKLIDIRMIESVSFKKSFPDTIIISVKERKPVALLLFNNKLFYVDQDGKLFSGIRSKFIKRLKNRLDYPVITGIDDSFKAEDKTRFIKLSLSLLYTLGEKSILSKEFVSEIHVDKKRGLSLTTIRRALPIFFGFKNFEKKNTRLNYVLTDIEKKHLKVLEIDLDFNKKVVVKKGEGI